MALRNSEQDAIDLYNACTWSGGYDKVITLLRHGTDPNHQCYYTSIGYTPLHTACCSDYTRLAVALIQWGADIEAVDSYDGHTPLHDASSRGSLGAVKALLENHCNTDAKNKRGDTALDVAIRCNKTEVVELLKSHVHHLPKDPLSVYPSLKQLCELTVDDIWFNLGLDLGLHQNELTAIQGKSKDTEECKMYMFLEVKRRTTEFTYHTLVSAILKSELKGQGHALVTVAAQFEWLDVVKYFEQLKKCDLEDCLLISCKHNHGHIVDYSLNDRHCDPNVKNDDGQTPLALTTDNKIIRSLLKHGARAADVYKTHHKALGKLSSKQLPENPLPILITGKGGAGKSTFLKALLFVFSLLQQIGLFKVEPASNVDKKTVGIIPYLYETKQFGRVAIYDFAGQEEFYASHSAVLQNALHTCPPIIIFCCNLLDSVADIMKTTAYWMNLIQNQCSALQSEAHVFVVGSHADLLGKGVDPRSKEGIFGPIIEKFPKFKFLAFVPMDCRLPDSAGMKLVRRHIEKSSALLRFPEAISLNAHSFHIYLEANFTNELAVTLEVVRDKLEDDLKLVQPKSKKDLLSFIPNTLPRVIEICSQLSKMGHIMFLPNKSTPENSYVVCDQQALLSEITGTVYAPKDFRQHCKLASSTGVVALFKFHIQFKQHDLNMLLAFMSHLEFCFEIKDEQVLKYISTQQQESPASATASHLDNRYLFFPGLITIAFPERVWEPQAGMKFHFGWILHCSQDIQFFDARCLHVLILRLVFIFKLAPATDVQHDIPSLQRFCSVWKNGIYWHHGDGIACLVELVEHSKALTVQIRCRELTPECQEFRGDVVRKVLETAQQVCPNLDTIESVILPAEVETHPLNTISQLSLFEIHNMALAVHTKKAVNSLYISASLSNLLQFEPLACLDRKSLSFLYHPQNASLAEKVSNSFIAHLDKQMKDSNDKVMLGKIISKVDADSSSQGLSHTLETWRSETEGTYQCLRDTLDKYSIFGGRNPLDLARVPPGDWDPSLLAAIEEPEPVPEHTQTDLDIESVDATTRLDAADDTAEILKELTDLDSKFFKLGLSLHLSPGKMETIQENHPHNCEASLSVVIVEWLKLNYDSSRFGRPSWRLLVEAVSSVDLERAKQIARRHPKVCQTSSSGASCHY